MIHVHLVDENGTFMPDSMVDNWVDTLVETVNKAEHDLRVDIAQDLILTAIRARVSKGEIDHTKILFHHKDCIIRIDHLGNLSEYPEWCHRLEKYLMELLT